MRGSVSTHRSFALGVALAAVMVLLVGALAGCSSGSRSSGSSQPTTAASGAAQTPATSHKVLVAYFSATGNTERVSNMIASHTNGTLFKITPQQPYSSDDLDYNNQDSRVSTEHNDVANVDVKLVQVTPDDFSSYDTVFIGYPIWWGDPSWALKEFMAGNDFSGKTVIPFCTSSSSSIGSSVDTLKSWGNGSGNWLEGRRFSSSASESEVNNWLGDLGY
jgi:flavodoxin